MPKRAQFLTDRQVRALREPGLYAVGGTVPGLALQVTQVDDHAPARSWVLRVTTQGRRRAFGLGSFPMISLADAREKAQRLRRDALEGRVPVKLAAGRTVPVAIAGGMTFARAAEQYIAEHQGSWKNEKHGKQWAATLTTYAYR